MGVFEDIKLARKHSSYVRSLPPTHRKSLKEHDQKCPGC